MVNMTIIERKMKIHDLKDETEVKAYDAIGYMIHRQWIFCNHSNDRQAAVKYLANIIRQQEEINQCPKVSKPRR